jgi:DNA sulfur modification protein DndD
MILEEIRLSDFRCFYGKSTIKFSTDEEKNVTLIYAENGVGKTTLLNALLWCFYGETTERFEKKEDILNYDAKKEGRTTASVEVMFEHNDKDYIAKRFFVTGPRANEARTFVVASIEQGSQNEIQTPDTFINTVIPRDMASHFLFDGEHAEVFLGESNRDSIKGAVRDILGCSLVETAIDDLQTVSNQFRKQIPSTPATTRIAELNSRMDALATQVETAADEVKRLEKQHFLTDTQIGDIDQKLRNTSAAKELQRSRDRLHDQLARTEKRRKDAANDVYKWLGEDGRYIVSKKITEETFGFLDDKKHRGRIPSPYNEEFVKDILAEETCICGAHLEPGSPATQKVAQLLNKAANQVVRDRIAKVRARLSSLKSGRAKAPGNLMESKDRLAEANEELASVEAQLGEIHEKLKGIDFEDIASREERRAELKKELSAIDRQIGIFKGNIEDAEREKAQIDREINELAKLDQQTAIYAKRRSLCESIKGTLELHLVTEENEAKKALRAGIRKVLQATTHKVLTPRMTDDYVISLVNAEGRALPKSSGENQLLGLAFTAALVEFAKIRKNAGDYRLLPGTVAPLVLDSPFGQLDESYRSMTAQFIPKMARQVVLLLSRSQASKEVLEALENHVGAEFLLVRHNREPLGERQPEVRYLKGEEFRTAVFDSDYDGTEIKELAVQ